MNTIPPANDDTAKKARQLMDKLDAESPSEASGRRAWMERSPGGPNLLVVLSPLWAWVLAMIYFKPSGAAAFFVHLVLGATFIFLAWWSWKGSLGSLGLRREASGASASSSDLHEEVRRAKERRDRYEKMRARHEKVTQRKNPD